MVHPDSVRFRSWWCLLRLRKQAGRLLCGHTHVPACLVLAVFLVVVIATELWRRGSLGNVAAVQCPDLYSIDSDDGTRHLIPTLTRLFVDHQEGITSPHPLLYSQRVAARAELGPIYWARLHERGEPACVLVVGDAALASQLFEHDGVALGRQYVVSKEDEDRYPGAFSGLKFAVGSRWRRQRDLITNKVLTAHAKYERGVAAAPSATACFSEALGAAAAGGSSSSRDMAHGHRLRDVHKLAQRCMAEFMISAVFGEKPFEARAGLVTRLVECETQECSPVEAERGPGSFACMHEVVRRETETRLALMGDGSLEERRARDRNHASLLSRLLLLTDNGALSTEEATSNAISFTAAGWETSTLTLLNTLWPLVAWTSFPRQSERFQRALAAAETTKTQPDGGGGGEGQLAAQLLAETLRWRPPVPWHAGNALQPIQAVSAGTNKNYYEIPAGTRLVVDVLSVNALPEDGFLVHWDPTGQLAGDEAGVGADGRTRRHHPSPPYQATEFAGGVGSRHCPGGKMARHGMERILEAVFADWEIRLPPQEEEARRLEAWVQAYNGNMMTDLCGVLGTELEVLVRRRGGSD